MKYIVLGFLLTLSLHTIASNSAGGRGGGTGIVCGQGPLKLIEEYELNRDEVKIVIPTNRDEVHRFMKKKLRKWPDLFSNWESIWKEIGPYEQWPIVTDEDNGYRVRVKTLKHFLVETKNIDFKLEKDDYFKTPSHCELKQISLFYKGQIFKYELLDKLSQRTKRMLELHESFYILGTNFYGHLFPIKTRELIKNFNENAKEIEKSLRRFMINKEELNYASQMSGTYQLSLMNQEEIKRCPVMATVLIEPGEEIQTLGIYLNPIMPSFANQLVVGRVEEKSYPVPDLVTLFTGSGVTGEVIYFEQKTNKLSLPFDGITCDFDVFLPNVSATDRMILAKDMNQAFRAIRAESLE